MNWDAVLQFWSALLLSTVLIGVPASAALAAAWVTGREGVAFAAFAFAVLVEVSVLIGMLA